MMRTFLDSLAQDLRYAARTLARTPGFTIVAVLTLAPGIGANTAIFSVVNAVLLRPLPYPNADRLVRIFGSVPPADGSNGPARRVPGVQVPDIAPLRAETRTLSHIALNLPLQATLTGLGEATRIEGARMPAEGFAMLGGTPILGRVFEPQEESSGADSVIVLSYAMWQRSFGGAADVIGRSLALDGKPYSVIGVMPRGFEYPDPQTTRFWVP